MQGRTVSRAPRGFPAVVLLGVVALSGIGLAPARSMDVGGLAPAGATGPDIVLIVTDDQRWDTLWAMPILQQELIAKGMQFTNAFVVNPLCCPSRASILTGLYSHSTGIYSNGGDHGGFRRFRDRSTVATWLDAAGYQTAFVGRYLKGYPGGYVPPGWDRWVSQTEGAYYFYELTVDGERVRYGARPEDYSIDVTAGFASDFIRDAAPGAPLFMVYAPAAPHTPAEPARRHLDAFDDLEQFRPPNYNETDVSDKPRHIRRLPLWTKDDRQRVDQFRRDQHGTLLAVDDAIGSIVGALAETGRLRNTMLVFTSDNGFLWGEHRLDGKLAPYEESIRVPMVIRHDAVVTPGTERDDLVLNIDLAPTFATLGSALPPGHPEGRSLVPLLTGSDEPWRNDFIVEHLGGQDLPTYCALRTLRYLYVEYRNGIEEVYDLRDDRYELTSLVGQAGSDDEIATLRARADETCVTPPSSGVIDNTDEY